MAATLTVNTEEIQRAGGLLDTAADTLAAAAQQPIDVELYADQSGGPPRVAEAIALAIKRVEDSLSALQGLGARTREAAMNLYATADRFDYFESIPADGPH